VLVLPTETLPKLRVAGLALSAPEGTELGVAEVELIDADVELPLALVTPVQPERITADSKSVDDKKKIGTRGMEHAYGPVEM
jgi:hypothetical protein